MPLRIGTSRVDITPATPLPMQGGFRPAPARGIGSRLFARGFIAEDGANRVGLVSCDVLAISHETLAEVNRRLPHGLGLRAGRDVMLCPSHSHRGPAVFDVYEYDLSPEYLDRLAQGLVDAISQAAANPRPAELSYTVGTVEGISRYRRFRLRDGSVSWGYRPEHEPLRVGPLRPVDAQLGLVSFWRDQEPVAMIANYTCHPNCPGNPGLLSADYPGVLCRELESVWGHQSSIALFLTGACGNIDPAGTADELGQKLAAEARRLLTLRVPRSSDVSVHSEVATIRYPARSLAGLQEEEIERTFHKFVSDEQFAIIRSVFQRELGILKEKAVDAYDLQLQTVVLGEIAFAGVPGELFVELGVRIKEESPFIPTFVVELVNAGIGYLPTRQAFREGGYETVVGRHSPFAPGAGEAVADAAITLLTRVKARLRGNGIGAW